MFDLFVVVGVVGVFDDVDGFVVFGKCWGSCNGG